ncbi:hypothetical protein TNCV_4013011 [Trichonephila clavipes]|nr:hypothetical protein TNCV_4013011 [Trichonephila clavipes]
MDSWIAFNEFQPNTAEDMSCRWGRCTLNLSRLKRPPMGVVWKLGERMASSGIVIFTWLWLKITRVLNNYSNTVAIRKFGVRDFQISLGFMGLFIFFINAREKELCTLINEVLDRVRQINLEVDSDNVQEMLEFPNEELTIDELI